MANNYCETSLMIALTEEEKQLVLPIMARVQSQLEENPEYGYAGYLADVQKEGLWVRANESVDPDHVEILVRAVVEELQIPYPIACTWSYTCSKPRVGEFGGGAFVVQLGKPTVWVDALTEALKQAGVA